MNTEKEIGTLIQIIAEKNEEIENYKNQINELRKKLSDANETLDSLWHMNLNLEDKLSKEKCDLAKEIFKKSQENSAKGIGTNNSLSKEIFKMSQEKKKTA